jgi:hypothetical protein
MKSLYYINKGIEMNTLNNYVKDWGGFEKLVADLNSNGEFKVEHNVKLSDKYGICRQIDVLITHKVGLYEQRIMCECKFWNQKVKIEHVDALITKKNDLNIDKAVFFTNKGYQSGAELKAKQHNIDLFIVKDITKEDWGLPGREIRLYLQIISRAIKISKIKLLKGALITNNGGLNLQVDGNKGFISKTPIFDDEGKIEYLEEIIEKYTSETINKEFLNKGLLINSGEECTRYLKFLININKTEHYEFSIDLIIKIQQSQIKVDRGKDLVYAFLCENSCNQEATYYVTKNIDSNYSNVIPKVNKESNPPDDDVFKNDSILGVLTKFWFDPSEIDGLKEVNFEEIKKPLIKKGLK